MLLGSVLGFSFQAVRTLRPCALWSRRINQDYQAQIDTIQAETDHQELLFTGSRATWPEILSVYAVMVVTDPEAPRRLSP